MACKFFEMIEKRWAAGARVCVGLDSDPNKLPKRFWADGVGAQGIYPFNQEIIDATKDLALAYKPNIAFYSGREDDSLANLATLSQSICYIRDHAPDVPIILDSKRGDIGNTNLGYVREAFEEYDADAVTVSPYFGMEAMKPFLEQSDKGIIVLCRTSNPGADEFQNLPISIGMGGRITMPLYQYIAERVVKDWNYNGNCALVVGATASEELTAVRRIVGDSIWLLLPGIGTQGGDLFEAVMRGKNSKKSGFIVNSSSKIIFSEDPRAETITLGKSINAILDDAF